MTSRIKRALDDTALTRLVAESFGAGAILMSGAELTDGLFNAAYHLTVATGEGTADVVVKVAPAPGTPLLTYERDLLRTEARFYTLATERAVPVPLPAVVHAGFARRALDGDYLVMSRLAGRPLSAVGPRLAPDERRRLRVELGRHVAALHRLGGDAFGYPQPATGLQGDTWPEAFAVMVDAVLDDAGRYGVTLPVPAAAVRRLVADHADALGEVRTPVLTHFDLWDGNVLVGTGPDGPRIEGLIDAERAFWGDPHADLASLALWRDITDDDPLLAGYRDAGGRIDLGGPLRRRLLLYRAYLDLIMLVEAVPRGFDEPEHVRIRAHTAAHLSRQLRALGGAPAS